MSFPCHSISLSSSSAPPPSVLSSPSPLSPLSPTSVYKQLQSLFEPILIHTYSLSHPIGKHHSSLLNLHLLSLPQQFNSSSFIYSHSLLKMAEIITGSIAIGAIAVEINRVYENYRKNQEEERIKDERIKEIEQCKTPSIDYFI